MSKHTPGPWEWNKYGALLHEDEIVLGIDGGCRRCDYPNEADVHLIAAAPDLLEALESMLQSFLITQSLDDYPIDAPCNKARAAIAKAKGEV